MNLINNYGEFALINYSNFSDRISLDYDYALNAVEGLDRYTKEEGRAKIRNKAAINILVEYGNHPREDRYLTAREAAAIQSFPGYFIFSGNAVTGQWKQVGNAVPPELARRIGLALIN